MVNDIASATKVANKTAHASLILDCFLSIKYVQKQAIK
jgi:hypothetical protein